MNQTHEAEINQLIADVMRDTGIRIDADDPIVAMLFAQKRELANFLQQFATEQTRQRDQFLADFQTHSEKILSAAEELQTQKQQMLTEILKANADDVAEIESKLLGSVNAKVQKRFEDRTEQLFGQFKVFLRREALILLGAQSIFWVALLLLLKR